MSSLPQTVRSASPAGGVDSHRSQPTLAVTPPASEQMATRGLFKCYRKGDLGIPVLQGIDLSVHEGEFLSIVGQSGSGKSTFAPTYWVP